MSDISLLVTTNDDNILIIAEGTNDELNSMLDIVNNDLCNGNAKVVTVDKDEYDKCKENIIELKQLIST